MPKLSARHGNASVLALRSDHLSIARCNGPWERHYQVICERINSIVFGKRVHPSKTTVSKRARSSDSRETIIEDVKGEEYTAVRSLIWYALILDDQGHLKSAEEEFEQVPRQWPIINIQGQAAVNISKEKVVLFCRGKQSCMRRGRGQFEEAEALSREVLEKATQLLGSGHELTLQCTRSLALALIAQDRLQEAFTLLRDTLEKEARDPYEDISQARLVSVLSTICPALGFDRLSVLLARNVLCAFEKLLGVDHHFTLLRATSLADALVYNHDYCQAKAINKQVLDSLEKAFGSGYPPALRVAKKLADILRFQADFDEAASLYERTYQKQKRRLGAGHHDTVSTRCGIAAIWALTERLTESKALLTNISLQCSSFRGSDYTKGWVKRALTIVEEVLDGQEPWPSDEKVSHSEKALNFFRTPWRRDLLSFKSFETGDSTIDNSQSWASHNITSRFSALQGESQVFGEGPERYYRDYSVGGFSGHCPACCLLGRQSQPGTTTTCKSTQGGS